MKRGLAKFFTTTLFAGVIGIPPDCDSPLLDPLDRFGGQDLGDSIFGGYEDPTGLPTEVAGVYARDAKGAGYFSSTPLENILGSPDGTTTDFVEGAGMVLTFSTRPKELTFYAASTERAALSVYAVSPLTFLKPREGEILFDRFYVLESKPRAEITLKKSDQIIPQTITFAEMPYNLVYIEFPGEKEKIISIDAVEAE